MIDKAFALGFAVGPCFDRLANTLFSARREDGGAVQYGLFAVTLHELGNSALAQAGCSHLAAQIANDHPGVRLLAAIMASISWIGRSRDTNFIGGR